MIIKNTLFPNQKTITLNVDSFENGLSLTYDNDLTSTKYAKLLKNFSFEDGCLKTGLGLTSICDKLDPDNITLTRDLLAINDICKVFHFYKYNQNSSTREDKLILISNDFNVYYINLFDQVKTLNSLRTITFTSMPNAIRYRLNGDDVIIFSSETDNMVVWDGINSPYEVLDAPKISSMALHYERLFTTVDGEKNSVWFSDDLDPTNWSLSLEEAGFIELIDERGALEKVISFSDYVYIFREYGISRLTAFGSQSNFSVSNLFVSSGKIFTNSVCVCGDRILFLASDGLYKFDGVDTVKILSYINKGFDQTLNQDCSACFFNGNYYLLCNFNQDNESSSTDLNTVLEINVTSNKLTNIIGDIDAKFITSINSDKLSGVILISYDSSKESYLPCIIDNSGKNFENVFTKQWHSPKTYLADTSHIKILNNIYIDTLGDLAIEIHHDNQITTFNISGKNTSQEIKTFIPLKNFSFKIISTTPECEIKNLSFEFNKTQRR